MKIAVDFDGTIVEHSYPAIGKEMLFAFATLKALEDKGHQLILWTYREGKELDEAVEFCKSKGMEFYAVNASYPGEVYEPGYTPRKVDAECFIDDRNVGGFPGWSAIWQMLHPEGGEFNPQFVNKEAHDNFNKPNQGIFKRFFGK